ncbi:MAG: RluA family pseudouridine synthase [Deltaproteobacteria bacterium]|nr:RluA family pseudouridine synthase [Deltaproteobacteria bacterium]
MEIIAIDPLFLVVNKPSGLLSVPGRGLDMQDCVVSRIKAMFPDCIDQPAVHRLDMDTSGLMVVARTSAAHRHLSLQFAERLVDKRYIALLEGTLGQQSGEIALPFRLDPDNRPHQIHDPLHGKMGISRWRLIGIEGQRSRVEFTPLTGRTHQLRLHAAHPLGLGTPIVGDRLYGQGRQPGEMLLHATYLAFQHPASGQRVIWESTPSF